MGTKQLVVHEALETTTWCAGSNVVVVDADDERGIGVLGGGRDDDPVGPALEVGGGVAPGR